MSERLHQLLDVLLAAPVIGTMRRQRFDRAFERGDSPGVCRGVYESFGEATAALPDTLPTGYDNEAPAALYRDRMDRLFASDYPMMFWLAKAFDAGATRILDFGGHVGLSYYAYRKHLTYPDTLSWQVVDVPAVVAAGRTLARERDTIGALSFADSLANAADADVLFTAGCVQYLERTLAEQLIAMSKPPERVLVNLLPLHPTREYWTVQSISGAFCPYRIQKRVTFFDAMAAAGYEIEDTWDNPEKGCTIKFQPEFDIRGYAGAAFRRRFP